MSREIGVPENNTQNYLPPGNRVPGADYLERLVLRFESINAHWLLTGDGDAFEQVPAEEPGTVYNVTKNRGNAIGRNTGTATQSIGASADAGDCQQKLAAAQTEITLLRNLLEGKDKIINLLEKSTNK